MDTSDDWAFHENRVRVQRSRLRFCRTSFVHGYLCVDSGRFFSPFYVPNDAQTSGWLTKRAFERCCCRSLETRYAVVVHVAGWKRDEQTTRVRRTRTCDACGPRDRSRWRVGGRERNETPKTRGQGLAAVVFGPRPRYIRGDGRCGRRALAGRRTKGVCRRAARAIVVCVCVCDTNIDMCGFALSTTTDVGETHENAVSCSPGKKTHTQTLSMRVASSVCADDS